MGLRTYWTNVIIAADTFVGVLIPGGHVGQTISSRASTARDNGRRWGCILCRVLDAIETNHCQRAVWRDRERALAVLSDLRGH